MQPAERLEDVDPVAAHVLVQAPLGKRIGEPDAPYPVADPGSGVGVDDAQVRVHAEAADQEYLAGTVVER